MPNQHISAARSEVRAALFLQWVERDRGVESIGGEELMGGEEAVSGEGWSGSNGSMGQRIFQCIAIFNEYIPTTVLLQSCTMTKS